MTVTEDVVETPAEETLREGPDPRSWPEPIANLIDDLEALQRLLNLMRHGPATETPFAVAMEFLERSENQLKIQIAHQILAAYGIRLPDTD